MCFLFDFYYANLHISMSVEQPGSKNPSSKRKADDSSSNDFVNEITESPRMPQKIMEKIEKTCIFLFFFHFTFICIFLNPVKNTIVFCAIFIATKISISTTTRKSLKTEKKSVVPVESEPWTILTHMKPKVGWVAYNPKIMRSPPLAADVKSVKVMSWNVNGLRALLKSGPSPALQLAQKEDFDVLCLQETKIQVRYRLLVTFNCFYHMSKV